MKEKTIIIKLDEQQMQEVKESIRLESLRLIDKRIKVYEQKKSLEEEAEFLNATEMSKYLNISRQTLYKYIDQGLPFMLFNNKKRFSKSSVTEWLGNFKKETIDLKAVSFRTLTEIINEMNTQKDKCEEELNHD